LFLQASELTLNTGLRALYFDRDRPDSIDLLPTETRLLAALMATPGKVVTRSELMKTVWQTDYLGDTRTLDVHICWLRRKLEDDPSHPRRIVTHRRRLPGWADPGVACA